MVPPVVERGSISKGAAPPARRRGRRPPPEELVEQRRNEIIEAAYEVFSTKGYTATGIADIAERLGIGHGTFYRYFKNKRDILDQVIDYGVERIVSAIRLETPEPPRSVEEFGDQMRHIGERLFALADAEPGLGQVVLLEATSIDEEMTQRVLGLFETFGALSAAFLRHGVKQGFLRSDLDTESVGRALTALVLPGLFAAVRGEVGAKERKRYIDSTVDLVCNGVGRR